MNKTNAHDKLMPLDIAQEKVLSAIKAVSEREQCLLNQAIDRVLCQPIISPLNVPPYANSAMDGYAFRHADIAEQTTIAMDIAGTAFAGKPFKNKIGAGQCIRIMTGAIIPEDLDTVIMQEWVNAEDQTAEFSTAKLKQGDNVRYAGEDIHKDQTVLAIGKRLTPADLGVLASLGIEKIEVWRKLRVAYFSTGDELKEPGTALAEGQIYDSNRYCLLGVLQRIGVHFIDLGIIPDDPAAIENALFSAAKQADVVLTSGGVSVGEADYVKNILEKIATIGFWKIAIKPGKPFTFGHIEQAAFFGLPGNPVSVMATYYQLVQPALLKMMGTESPPTLHINARCLNPLKKKPGRIDFQRGILIKQDDNQWVVQSTNQQDSHILSSMSQANCFIVLPAEASNIDKGDVVQVQPFSGII